MCDRCDRISGVKWLEKIEGINNVVWFAWCVFAAAVQKAEQKHGFVNPKQDGLKTPMMANVNVNGSENANLLNGICVEGLEHSAAVSISVGDIVTASSTYLPMIEELPPITVSTSMRISIQELEKHDFDHVFRTVLTMLQSVADEADILYSL